MGFAANQARLMSIISRRSDLELEAQFLNQQRLYLGNMVSGYFDLHARLEPGSPAANTLNAKIRSLQQADKMLEMHLSRIDNQRQAISKEQESVEKIINDNIQKSFGQFGSGAAAS